MIKYTNLFAETTPDAGSEERCQDRTHEPREPAEHRTGEQQERNQPTSHRRESRQARFGDCSPLTIVRGERHHTAGAEQTQNRGDEARIWPSADERPIERVVNGEDVDLGRVVERAQLRRIDGGDVVDVGCESPEPTTDDEPQRPPRGKLVPQGDRSRDQERQPGTDKEVDECRGNA